MRKRKFKIVQVHWHDSQFAHGWLSANDRTEMEEEGLPHIITVGILIKELDSAIIIANSVDIDTYAQAMKIPKCAIFKRRTIGKIKLEVDW